MIIYNLTDAAPMSEPGRKAQKIKVRGTVIEPGKHVEVSDLTRIPHGLVQQKLISVNSVPGWYQKARDKRVLAEMPAAVSEKLEERLKNAPRVGGPADDAGSADKPVEFKKAKKGKK